MSLTNNEVKFLVTLGIDETKSKTNINNFLSKVVKEQKLTFAVNIGKSNKNIKEFIDKQQNKKGKILFDVAVGDSNKNISRFLTNQKQAKKSLIFYVNEQATKASVNSALKKMSFNPVLIDLAVNTTQSKANFNSFIDTVKLHKKSIELALDSKNSRININKSLEKMILAKPKVKLSLAKDAFDQVNNNVSGKEFKGLKIVGELNVTKTKERIKEQIEKMSLPKFKVDVVAKVNPVISSKTVQQAVNTKQTPSKNTTSSSDTDSVKAYKNKAEAVKELKEEFKKAGKEITVFNGSVKKGEEDFINSLKKQGHQLDIVRDAQTKEITKVTATYKNSANEIQKTVFTPLISQYQTLNAKTSSATKEIRGFVAQVEKIKNTNTFELQKGIEEFNRKLKEVRNNTAMSAREFNEFSNKAKSITSNDQLERLNGELKDYRLELERTTKLEKARHAIIMKQEKLLANLIRTEKLHRRTVNKEEADAIRDSLTTGLVSKVMNSSSKKLDITEINAVNKMLDVTSSRISTLSANATEATKNSMGIISALKVAMEKFPIWMVASTAFYGTIGTLREFGSIIVDIDTKMTDLKKVMDADTNFDEVFNRATESAESFGKSISETMDAYTQFAKQGFKGDELEDYANAGLVAGNVGDIDAGKASEYLTASVLQWNKSSKDAMTIVDSWNELSNKYATTVENLAQGQAKAGATAKALGMDFNQLNAVIGTLNAKTKQSGNEIGNFWKSVAPRLVSDGGKSILESLGVELTDQNGNLRDIMQIYTEVAEAIKGISQEEQIAVAKGLAGTYHISRMQTLLDDLGSAESMYRSMYETANNSQNSAINENATYMQSLEARINLARVEIEKLALAIGEAFMTEGMIQFLQTFRIILSSITEFVSTFGALPAIFTGIVVTLAVFSNRFKGVLESTGKWIEKLNAVEKISNKLNNTTANNTNTNNTANTGNQKANTQNINNNTNATNKNTQANNANTSSVNKNTKAKKTNANTLKYRGNIIANNIGTIQRNTKATNADTTATNANTKATKALSYSKKALALGLGGLGVATMVVGYGLEKLLSYVAEIRQEEEEYQNTLAQSKKSYQDNAESIDKLVVRYKELSKQSITPDSEEYSELLEVQNELASLLPSLSKGEDAYGNAILDNAEILEQRVSSLKTQIELEKELADIKAKEANEEQINEATKNAEKAKKQLDGELTKLKNLMLQPNFLDISLKVGFSVDDIKSPEQLKDFIKEVESKLNDKSFVDSLSKTELISLEALKNELLGTFDETMKYSAKFNDNLIVVKSSVESEFSEMLESADDLDEGFVEMFANISSGALALAENTDGIEELQKAFSTITLNDKLQNEFTNLKSAFDRLKTDAVVNSDEIRDKYDKTFASIKEAILNASNVPFGSEAYTLLKKALDNATASVIENEMAVRDKVEAEGVALESARAMVEATSSQDGAIEDLTSTMKEYVDSIKKFDSLSEQMLGVNDSLISETEDLISVYNYLSNATNRTADEEKYLTEATNKLKALYPHLVKNKKIAIDTVIEEQKMNKVLLESYKNMADEKYNSEEEATYYSAIGTKARIENIKKEIEAIQSLYSAEYSKYEKLLEKQKNGTLSEKEAMWMYYASQSRGEYTGYAEYMEKMNELDELSNKLNTSLNKLSSTNSVITESTDKTSESTSEAEKVTNKYTLALKKLDTALKEVQAKQKKYPTYSSQYRKALEEENKLIQQQIELNKQQANDLSTAQSSASSASYTTFGTAQPKGWSGAITSNFGKRGSGYHVGIDIDGAIGDILESNVAGKVIQKGKDNVSGNYVTILDKDGLKHFYAHLDSISVALNDVVKVGTKIGTIGNTGNVISGSGGDGSHLHYGVKKGNTWIDPYSYVQQAKSGIQTSSSASTRASGNTNQDKVWSYFKSKGLNDKAIAGIMGNIAQESNFNASAVNKSSGASGIFQWLGTRKTALQSYAKSLGKSWTDLQVQLDFAWKELNSSEKKSLSSLQRGDLSASQHASEFERLFERSGGSAVAKRQNYANQYYNQYQGSGAITTNYSSSDSDSDDLLAQIESLKQENISLAEQLQENYYKIIKSRLEEFERNRDFEDLSIARQEELQQNMLKHNREYEDSVNKQYTAEQRKLKNMQQEYAYIQKMLNAGGLTLAQSDELIDKRYELQQLMLESQNQIKEYYNEVIESRLARFDNQMNDYSKSLTYLETKLQAIDRTNSRYNQTLSLMASNKKAQLTAMKQELEYVNKMLTKGNLTVEMYEELAQRAEDLKNELIETNQALHQLNYEMIQSIVFASDLKLDDVDFEINYSQSLRDLYEEGSGDYKNALEFELEKLKEKLELIEKKGKDIKEAMKGKDLGATELQELEEQLEDNALAYLDVLNAIKDTEEAIKSFTDTVNEQIEDLRSELADKIIDALKDAIEEAKDIKLDAIEKEIEAEEERHEKVMKQYDDELDAYRKIIDAKRREIDDADRDRTYNNKMEELNNERQEILNKLNLLSNVNTYEGIKEKEELQKQLADIEKEIAEEKYQYEKDLREQQLDDMLEEKEESIEDLKDKEDEYSDEVLKNLNKQKEYWEKYYTDLLNDEKYFAKMREDILSGNFDEVESQFKEHIKLLTDSLPELEDRFNGTWEAVGTQLRENVINNMKDLLEEIKKVEEEIDKLNNKKDEVTNEFGGVTDENQTVENAGNSNNLSEADMKVLLAKFMNEQIAGSLDPEKDAVRIKNIKDKASQLASEGRAEGSTISANQSLSSILDSMSTDQLKNLGNYFKNNSSASGFITQDYIDYIQSFGSTAQAGKTMTHGDKQVMLAKYMKEFLVPATSNEGTKQALRNTADKIAESGRKNTSLIPPTVGYNQALKMLTEKQQAELGKYMLDNATVVGNASLQNILKKYAESLMLNSSNDFVGLNTGGMTKAFGSTGGVDGKGGRFALLHQNEITLNPIDSERMLKVASVMDNIMRTINSSIALPSLPKVPSNTTSSTIDSSTSIHITIENMNGTKNDIDNLAKQIQNRLLREKGKR